MKQKYWTLYMKTQYLLSLLATLNHHKIVLFERNGARMVGQLRRYKRYVEQPQRRVTRTVPILFICDHSV